MTVHHAIAAMLAGRRILKDHCTDSLVNNRQLWDGWLRAQRTSLPILDRRKLVVVAELTCLDDLLIHTGVMQLLGARNLRCRVVLSLPTPEIARIVQAHAWREGWHGFVEILAAHDCAALLHRLPDGTALAVFRAPAPLSPEALSTLSLENSSTFLGDAGAYRNWSQQRESLNDETFAASLNALLSYKAAPPEPPPAPHADIKDAACSPWAGDPRLDLGRIELPDLGPDEELLVSRLEGPPDEAVIARQSGDLHRSEQPLRIRAPISLLTPRRHRIRLETRRVSGEPVATELDFHVPPSRISPWMISAFLNRGGGGNPVVRAFSDAVGCRLAYAEDEPEILSEIPIVWGVLRDSDRILAQAKAQSLYYYYIDHAYFNRGHGKNYRITRNGYDAGAVRACPIDRFQALNVAVSPWRKSGRDIIVCPPTDYFMAAHNCADWLETTLATLRKCSDRPITVRVKPQPGEQSVPLQEALETAHALVTHSSNVAIEAACLGTPVFVAPGSAAAPIGSTDLTTIETPLYPERMPWLAHLAHNQYSFEECANGTAWEMLREFEERDFV
jgi:hypothetical protein